LLVAFVAVALALPGAACATYQDDLARSQRAFEANEHERALAILRHLEPDTRHLAPAERAHYAYLRGMTDYRVGYRGHARHWLMLAHAIEATTPNALPTDWSKRLAETLTELNEEVYTNGSTQALERKGGAKAAPSASTKKDSDYDP
jgi:hypothetical protein